MDFNLSIPVKVISGENCVRDNAELLKPFGKKCAIITGKNSAKICGALDDVIFALEKCNIEYKLFDEITQNPVLQTCHKIAKQALEFGAEFVLGIGGGSPLDAAKAVAVFMTNPDFSENDIFSAPNRKDALELVLIGTTAGTGSEVGAVAVLTDEVSGRKKSINYTDCIAKLAFADFKYTKALPYDFTVSTALDALSHTVEGYLSKRSTSIAELFAEKAVVLIWEGLQYFKNNKTLPTDEIREKLFYGSLYAGITLSYCGTGFPHPLGYIFTENKGIAHGKACTAFMSDFVERAAEFETEKLAKILSLIGETQESFLADVELLTDLNDVKFTKEELDVIFTRFDEVIPANFGFSPGGFTVQMAREIFDRKFLVK